MLTSDWFGTAHYGRAPELSTAALREMLWTGLEDTGMLPSQTLPAGPFVIPARSYGEIFRAARLLLDLVRRTMLSLADDTTGRIAALGADMADYPLLYTDELIEEEFAASIARPDVIIGEDGPKILEFNPSGAVSGVIETHLLLRTWRAAYQRTGTFPFQALDPLVARADLFADTCTERGLPPRLAWIGSRRDLPLANTDRFFDVELEYLHSRGFTARHFEPEEVSDGLLDGPGGAYPLGLRQFTISEWRDHGIDLAPIRQILDAGCLLLPTQSAGLLDHKKVLALLSTGPAWMSTAERAIVARYLPWTRILADEPADWHGSRSGLLDLVERHQDRFVVKRGEGMKGLQVVIGRETDPSTWRSTVQDALKRQDSVVQEYVAPASCHLEISMSDHDTEVASVAPVLSPFLFGGRPAGLWARFFAPGRHAGVVSRDGYGAMENVVVAES
ncbi:hypothetical protein AB0368_33910 [Actinoplanes sp. NPDC051475]|uniref:hypothetical protein n=1 Tax=Actinoplanes sp. NPDC051475 TaxID=3157225 RepID=UPI00344DC542